MCWINQAWDWVCEDAGPLGSFNVPSGLVSFRRTMIIDDETMMTKTGDFEMALISYRTDGNKKLFVEPFPNLTPKVMTHKLNS